MLRPRETAVITDQGRITVYGIWRGIFNYLPLLQMTLLHMKLLHWLLRFCHRRSSGATKLGLSLMWQATSRVQRGIGTENDEDTPVFTMSYPLLPLVCVGPACQVHPQLVLATSSVAAVWNPPGRVIFNLSAAPPC
jgi:hypothetical protein